MCGTGNRCLGARLPLPIPPDYTYLVFSGLLRYQLTKIAAALGPGNPILRFSLRAACRRFHVQLRFEDNAISVSKDRRIVRIAPGHFPYVLDVSRHFETYFAQVVPECHGENLIVDYSRPRLQRYTQSGIEFELSSLAEEGDALEGYFHWYKPCQGDVVFDIGAYCGVSTYHFSKLVGPAGWVYSFEPDPMNYSLLLRNIERHRLTNVVPLQMAVSASSGTAEFASEAALGSALSSHLPRATTGKVETVKTISFADACSQWGVPAFVKMDIEGAEIETLSSARPLLMDHSIHFVLDTNHWIRGVRTNGAVERLFIDCGFQVESSDKFGFMTTWARKSIL